MSKIVHPYAHRLPLDPRLEVTMVQDGAEYRDILRADMLIREYLEKKLRGSYIADIEFERNQKSTRIIIATSRPGMLIGRTGEGATKLKIDLVKFMKKRNLNP